MATRATRLTYREYLGLPETMERYEIVDGEMRMTPAPTVRHQRILVRLMMAMASHVEEQGLGEVLPAPVDILVSPEPLRTRQPDLVFVSSERAGIVRDQIEGGPDLVAETLSPGSRRGDIREKLADYERLGVREVWLVSPEAQSVEVLTLRSGEGFQRLGLWGAGESMRSEVLSGLSMPVDRLFATTLGSGA